MPLLRRGPEVFPQSLFDLSSADFPWMVAQTRSRQEKALVRNLEPLHVPFYLPQHERHAARSGRRFVSFIPLFPGYVFLRADPGARTAALPERSGRPAARGAGSGAPPRGAAPAPKAPGDWRSPGALRPPRRGRSRDDRVRVRSGVTGGASFGSSPRSRLIVSVSMLRQSVAVEFDRSSLNRVSGDARTVAEQSAVA